MKWTKQKPTKPGIYLRNNPAVLAVVRQDVIEIEGVLQTTSGEGYLMPLKGVSDTFLWYGPIPKPPRRRP